MPPHALDVPQELVKDPSSWTVEDVCIWLRWLGIDEHVEAFTAQAVDGRALLRVSAESAWSALGVADEAQQRVLDSAAEPLRVFRDTDGAEAVVALHAVEGPLAGEVILVGAGGITGGRHSTSNGIVLSENYVSRRHFELCQDAAGQILLQDVGSTTGTFLMVREELPLEDGHVLQLGTTEVLVSIDGDVCTLVATEGPGKDARASVQAQDMPIGRDLSNGLCCRDAQVSAFHAEVRYSSERGFVLEDRYSTNRTWLRLGPDGQASKRYVVTFGDVFKVGSTLLHVLDPAALPADGRAAGPAANAAAELTMDRAPAYDDESDPADSDAPSSWRLALSSRSVQSAAGGGQASVSQAGFIASGPSSASDDGYVAAGNREEYEHVPPGGLLRWEQFREGVDARPAFDAREYSRLVAASREERRIPGSGELQPSQASMVQERELSSLQQGMRNSRAQTAYALEQRRPAERRDEDLCKICYDKDIEVVLYPCGHYILCRWCAYKVSDCPVCRVVITHVIRTYKA